MKNLNIKKVLIVGIIIIIIIAIAIMLLHRGGNSNNNNNTTETEYSEQSTTLYTHQVIDIENLETSLYKDLMKTTKNFKIASKYKIGKEATTIDAKVDMYLDGKIARALYIRDNDTKLNVVQLKYQIVNNDETPEEIQVEELMRDFEMECKSNMGVMDLEREPDEVNIKDDNMTYVEKIYNNKELYSARYNVQDEHFTEEDLEEMQIDKSEYTKTYDINYYMDGDSTLVCEFVRIL